MTYSKTQPPHYLHYVKLLTPSSFKSCGAYYEPSQVKLPLFVDTPQLKHFSKISNTPFSTPNHPHTLSVG